MKVIAKLIEVVAWFDKIGTVHPIRFRIMQNEAITTVITGTADIRVLL